MERQRTDNPPFTQEKIDEGLEAKLDQKSRQRFSIFRSVFPPRLVTDTGAEPEATLPGDQLVAGRSARVRVSKGMREKTRRNEGKDRVRKEVTRISSGLLLTLAPESESYLKVAHHFSWEEFLARLPPHFSHPSSTPTNE
ncbi:hypothetical protein K0M31_006261 [Melipona bicolor]|uniref:Uncharacterized protein n=1 Tax=Melipona bicolor TaxID=60889 RepID=A0AA40KLM0_9HYME|nr:hypothetical protein K0M31_006261 [Melipona bicolor]